MPSSEDARTRPLPTGRIAPTPPGGPNRTPAGRRLPWLIAILVILLLAIGTVATLLVRANRETAKPATTTGSAPSQPVSASASPSASSSVSGSNPTGSSTPSASASQPPALLPRGAEAPGSAIPWQQVDNGWNLRAWAGGFNPNTLPSTTTTLYLVNPVGGRYRIATLPPASTVELWSPGYDTAIVQQHATQRLQTWDLRTGRLAGSFPRNNGSLAGYGDPRGRSLMLHDPSTATQPGALERVNSTGTRLRSYPGSASVVGEFGGPSVVLTADGSRFMVPARRGFAVLSINGPVLRQILGPPGDQSCQLMHNWIADSVLARCSGQDGRSTLYSVPMAGGSIRAITGTSGYGFIDAWPYSGGTLLQRAGPCGPGGLATMSAGGSVRDFTFTAPAGVSGIGSLIAVYGNRASMHGGACGGTKQSLYSIDLHSHLATVLLGPGLNGGTVF